MKNVPVRNLTTSESVVCDRIAAPAREVWPDLLRVAAIFGVIAIHVSFRGMASLPTGTAERFFCLFFLSAGQYSVPVFLMLSGMFLLNPHREYTIKKIYTSNILRLVIASVVWSLFYMGTKTFIDSHANNEWTASSVFQFVFYGKYHLWYIYVTIGLYVITPFWRVLVQQEYLMKYFFVLAFLLVCCCDTISTFPDGTAFLQKTVKIFDIHLVSGYCIYFVLGYYLSVVDLKPYIRKIIYAMGMAAFLSFLFASNIMHYFFHFNLVHDTNILTAYISPSCLFEGMSVFVFFRYNFSTRNFSPVAGKIITKIGKLTFGIYLVHLFVLEHLELIGLGGYFLHPAISIPFIILVTFLFSLVLAFTLSMIPYVNRYVI